MTKVFIDGSAGTTGLQIYDRLSQRADVELMLLPDEVRKEPSARKDALNSCDIAFLCLPDDAAVEAEGFVENPNVKLIDASTAHRVSDGWIYGLPEIKGQREKIAASKRIANPGCYATGFITLVRPLIENGILGEDSFIACHALSGYTGGGKKTIAQYEARDRDEELSSPRHYALSLSHKHIPEMMKFSLLKRKPLFAPIICDFPQGMVVSVMLDSASMRWEADVKELLELYGDYYSGSPVIKIGNTPQSGFLGSNNLGGRDNLEIFVSGNDEQVILSSRLDNLGKGASGAAVQNMNILLNIDETTGLSL